MSSKSNNIIIKSQLNPSYTVNSNVISQTQEGRLQKECQSIRLLSRDAAPNLIIGPSSLTCTGEKGYRSIRASHGINSGSFYYEVLIHPSPLSPLSSIQSSTSSLFDDELTTMAYGVNTIDYPSLGRQIPKQGKLRNNRNLPGVSQYTFDSTLSHSQKPHVRIGFGTSWADTNSPTGHDHHSFAYRDVNGQKIHANIHEHYGESYQPGDIIGCLIHFPPGTDNINPLEEQNKLTSLPLSPITVSTTSYSIPESSSFLNTNNTLMLNSTDIQHNIFSTVYNYNNNNIINTTNTIASMITPTTSIATTTTTTSTKIPKNPISNLNNNSFKVNDTIIPIKYTTAYDYDTQSDPLYPTPYEIITLPPPQTHVVPGSFIEFFKNGISQGIAFMDLRRYTYFPQISLFMYAKVTANFGPDFAYPPMHLSRMESIRVPLSVPQLPSPFYPFQIALYLDKAYTRLYTPQGLTYHDWHSSSSSFSKHAKKERLTKSLLQASVDSYTMCKDELVTLLSSVNQILIRKNTTKKPVVFGAKKGPGRKKKSGLNFGLTVPFVSKAQQQQQLLQNDVSSTSAQPNSDTTAYSLDTTSEQETPVLLASVPQTPVPQDPNAVADYTYQLHPLPVPTQIFLPGQHPPYPEQVLGQPPPCMDPSYIDPQSRAGVNQTQMVYSQKRNRPLRPRTRVELVLSSLAKLIRQKSDIHTTIASQTVSFPPSVTTVYQLLMLPYIRQYKANIAHVTVIRTLHLLRLFGISLPIHIEQHLLKRYPDAPTKIIQRRRLIFTPVLVLNPRTDIVGNDVLLPSPTYHFFTVAKLHHHKFTKHFEKSHRRRNNNSTYNPGKNVGRVGRPPKRYIFKKETHNQLQLKKQQEQDKQQQQQELEYNSNIVSSSEHDENNIPSGPSPSSIMADGQATLSAVDTPDATTTTTQPTPPKRSLDQIASSLQNDINRHLASFSQYSKYNTDNNDTTTNIQYSKDIYKYIISILNNDSKYIYFLQSMYCKDCIDMISKSNNTNNNKYKHIILTLIKKRIHEIKQKNEIALPSSSSSSSLSPAAQVVSNDSTMTDTPTTSSSLISTPFSSSLVSELKPASELYPDASLLLRSSTLLEISSMDIDSLPNKTHYTQDEINALLNRLSYLLHYVTRLKEMNKNSINNDNNTKNKKMKNKKTIGVEMDQLTPGDNKIENSSDAETNNTSNTQSKINIGDAKENINNTEEEMSKNTKINDENETDSSNTTNTGDANNNKDIEDNKHKNVEYTKDNIPIPILKEIAFIKNILKYIKCQHSIVECNHIDDNTTTTTTDCNNNNNIKFGLKIPQKGKKSGKIKSKKNTIENTTTNTSINNDIHSIMKNSKESLFHSIVHPSTLAPETSTSSLIHSRPTKLRSMTTQLLSSSQDKKNNQRSILPPIINTNANNSNNNNIPSPSYLKKHLSTISDPELRFKMIKAAQYGHTKAQFTRQTQVGNTAKNNDNNNDRLQQYYEYRTLLVDGQLVLRLVPVRPHSKQLSASIYNPKQQIQPYSDRYMIGKLALKRHQHPQRSKIYSIWSRMLRHSAPHPISSTLYTHMSELLLQTSNIDHHIYIIRNTVVNHIHKEILYHVLQCYPYLSHDITLYNENKSKNKNENENKKSTRSGANTTDQNVSTTTTTATTDQNVTTTITTPAQDTGLTATTTKSRSRNKKQSSLIRSLAHGPKLIKIRDFVKQCPTITPKQPHVPILHPLFLYKRQVYEYRAYIQNRDKQIENNNINKNKDNNNNMNNNNMMGNMSNIPISHNNMASPFRQQQFQQQQQHQQQQQTAWSSTLSPHHPYMKNNTNNNNKKDIINTIYDTFIDRLYLLLKEYHTYKYKENKHFFAYKKQKQKNTVLQPAVRFTKSSSSEGATDPVIAPITRRDFKKKGRPKIRD